MKHEVYLRMNEQLHPSPNRIEEAVKFANRKPHIRMKKLTASLIAVAVLCGSVSLAASANEDFRQTLFDISPEIGAAFTPVMKSCISENYRMTVEGVHIDGDESSFIIRIDGLEGSEKGFISCAESDCYIQRAWIPSFFDMTSVGVFGMDYDEDAPSKRFQIILNEPGAGAYWGDTITFTMPDIVVGIKNQTDMEIPIDWNTVNDSPEMQTLTKYPDAPLALKPGEPQPLYDEIQLTGIAYRADKLHIQTLVQDWNCDSSAAFWLIDADGNRLDADGHQCYHWEEGGHNYQKHWREKRYEETVIEVDRETLQGCTLHAWTRTGGHHVRGNWKVKFPLKEEQ